MQFYFAEQSYAFMLHDCENIIQECQKVLAKNPQNQEEIKRLARTILLRDELIAAYQKANVKLYVSNLPDDDN